MASSPRRIGGLPLKALALALGAWVFSGSCPLARGGDGPVAGGDPGRGTLGYGGPGLFPGFQGFGLGYFPGYGYGGGGLGVGATGGDPFYAGPGYPHGTPRLRRLGPITPFPYFGGPGYPSAGCPQFFGVVGPLSVDRPIVLETDGQDHAFGVFTGALPYPEAVFAPYASAVAASGSTDGGAAPSLPAAPPASPAVFPPADPLGIDEEPAVDVDGVRGIKIVGIHPGTAADKSGLRIGDVIRSANGYLTTRSGNLTWIIANEAQGHLLEMNVRTVADGNLRVIRVQLPVAPVNTGRPPSLPPVGNGPPPASR